MSRIQRAAIVALAVWFVSPVRAPAAEPEAPGRPVPHEPMVFAHYMACLSNGVEFAREEIELAGRHGIDGFALNCLNWGRPDPESGKIKLIGHGKGAADIYEAARQLGGDFKLFVSADVNGNLNPLDRNMLDMVERFANHPNQFRHDGKVVLSAWAGGPATYAAGCRLLAEKGHRVHFVPFVSNRRHVMAWSFQNLLRLLAGQDHVDGWFFFACDGLVNDIIAVNAVGRHVTQHLGKTYMAGVAPAYNSPNLRDFRGLAGYLAMWEGLIRDGADWVEIVTWNDYNEDSNLMAYRWKEGWEKQYFDRDESYLHATSYAARWFKARRRPSIPQDMVFFIHRTRSRRTTRAWHPVEKRWINITRVKWPYDQIHDDVGDFVYLTTFLTAPADLAVRLDGRERTFSMPAGVAHAEVPLAPGVPQVTLRRDGKTLAAVAGRKLIIDRPTKRDSAYGYHLLNRTWANAAAVGPVRRFEAESGKLTGGAGTVRAGGRAAVRNEEAEGSGFSLDLAGAELPTATYNVRIVYSNPSAEEARLTLLADGPPRREKGYPHYIPAFLPPTGEGEFATTSFLWSLYETTTHLDCVWQAGRHHSSKAEAHPLYDDHGRVLIDAIELVRVLPFETPAPARPDVPEMVAIPGGSFTMGRAGGEPDEAPPHKVTISPFAIARHEVTNEQFERFKPEHRQFRDGFSWRDREPVIYVSWRDAAGYCNYLSRRAGLTPAYDEKTWARDAGADGYRLPTEAEWEYVASGRGEGRKWPWGDEPPRPGVHGNFTGPGVLTVDPQPRSAPCGGTAAVGSYPAGAARDGVLDLAGNVAEWCSDWFVPYVSEAATDPHADTKANHRCIRGGSWGYYGLSQRCTDREFNNPAYGGYIYVGFRVALPQSGHRKVRGR